MTNPGLEANSTGEHTKVRATTPAATVDDTGIDEWELEASRRMLMNLRTLLYGQPMLDLIKDQVEESDRQLKQYVADSHGEFTGTQVVLEIEGLSVQQLMLAIQSIMAGAASEGEERKKSLVEGAFPAHPEHYTFTPGHLGVIETMGGLPTRSHPAFVKPEDVPSFVTDLIDDSYEVSNVGSADLDDGTIFTYVLQEYKNTDKGLQASLRIWYPAACPPSYVEEHAQHYSIEFRNGARLAAAALHAGE